jgi:arylsulfatase A-like enzyme
MIARWPGHITAGSESDHISAFWDVLPTFAEVAGVRPPGGLDGISFLPSLLDREQPKHAYLYWEFHEGSSKQAVRMGDWKAVRRAPSRPVELYDLSKDIGEEKDLARQRPDMVAKAEEIFNAARSDTLRWPLKAQADSMPF